MRGIHAVNPDSSRDDWEPPPDAVAIVGIGCRFPGGASSPESFWKMLLGGVDAVTETPPERLSLWKSWGPLPPDAAGWGGFLQDIDAFDAAFFGISPREARHMDPQQRVLLETTWEAFEDAGIPLERLAGSATGVFLGIFLDEYWDLQRYTRGGAEIDAHTNTGGAMSIAANRLSHAFDLRGPSLSVDTACSSSLVAVHLACQSLKNGECDMALAGGVNLLLSPRTTQGFASASMLAKDGRCKAFDARADGYVRSEGAGILVLKPLAQALAARDPVYAVIRGSAVNQDGRTTGMTHPNPEAQEALMREAYGRAGVAPEQVRFIEAHGTGTPAGDPVEASALGRVCGLGREDDNLCAIGSVKTNIGHTEAAAGVAGMIKAALSLKYRTLPASLHFLQPHPEIPLRKLGLRVVTAPEMLHGKGLPLIAGVNSFGFGGANAHVVLQEAPAVPLPAIDRPDETVLIPLSARHQEALRSLARSWQDLLNDTGSPLTDLASAAGLRRPHLRHRLSVVCARPEEGRELIQAYINGERRTGLSTGLQCIDTLPKLIWVFTGMGPQWGGMGRELFDREPVFREMIIRCNDLFGTYGDWSLLDEMHADASISRMQETWIAQPANFALQMALSTLWNSWGLFPDMVMGHSVGEIAAACVAGALSLEEAARICFHRSRLQQDVSGQGTMLAVGLSPEEAEATIDGYTDRVSVAAINSPISVTLSGETAAITQLEALFTARKVFCRRLTVDVAYHSLQMDGLRAPFIDALHGLSSQPGSIPFVSTVTGRAMMGSDLDAHYWWRNVRDPVRLDQALMVLADETAPALLQIGPHPVLSYAITENLSHFGRSGVVLASLRRDAPERATLLQGLGTLYTLGFPVDWKTLYPDGAGTVALPAYPWQRERYWLDTSMPASEAVSRKRPLVGPHMTSSVHPDSHLWEAPANLDRLAFLKDHRIHGKTIYPAAAYLEMVFEAVQDLIAYEWLRIDQAAFNTIMTLSEERPRSLQISIEGKVTDTATFTVSSRLLEQENAEWTAHCSGRASVATFGGVRHERPDDISHRLSERLMKEDAYEILHRHGLHYGPGFQGIAAVWRGKDEALCRITVPEDTESRTRGYIVHPAILDALFQAFLFAMEPDGGAWAPADLNTLMLYLSSDSESEKRMTCLTESTDTALWAHVRMAEEMDQDGVCRGDVRLVDDEGQCFLEIEGVRLARLRSSVPQGRSLDRYLFVEQWKRVEYTGSTPPDTPGTWLIFSDSKGIGHAVRSHLEQCGQICITVTPGLSYMTDGHNAYGLDPTSLDEFRQLLQEVLHPALPPCRGILHLWNLDTPLTEFTTPDTLDTARRCGTLSVLHLIQGLLERDGDTAPRLWLVTERAQRLNDEAEIRSIAQTPVWGLGRTIALEHPELRCMRIDLHCTDAGSGGQAVWEEICAGDDEPETIRRDHLRYARRIIGHSPPVDLPGNTSATDTSYRLRLPSPGLIENLVFQRLQRTPPGPGEAGIQVRATGLNFRDVLTTLGMLPSPISGEPPLGWECVGTVVSTGAGVDTVEIGDTVLAIAPSCFSTYVVVPSALVIPKPAFLSDEEAATLPIAFLTAYYALMHLARLTSGERVLIHAATGGVGLAAIQVAQLAGAEIFATAGSPEKRAYLAALGVPHIMDSRSLCFADEIRRITGGEGVDVILNSLAGEAFQRSLSVLAPYGRFLELGKTDILRSHRAPLDLFEQNIAFFAIDLARLCLDRPTLAGSLFRELMQFIEEETLTPLPHLSYPIQDVKSAFQHMAQAKHMGKIVVTHGGDPVPVTPSNDAPPILRGDATYLITGGYGGLGFTVARWMANRGVRHLVLMGRRPPSASIKTAIEKLRRGGVEVITAQADVADEKDLGRVIRQIERSMPPLRGVIHAAGVLDDGILMQQTTDRFMRVMAPKVSGAWNLHTITRHMPMDFFVLFSSVSGWLGAPGQGNYAAANAFLDGLAACRRAEGLPALSIAWGPWSDVGMAADAIRENRLSLRGVGFITPEEGVAVLEKIVQTSIGQMAVLPVDPSLLDGPDLRRLFEEVEVAQEDRRSPSDPMTPTLDTIRKADPGRRRDMVVSYIVHIIARVIEAGPDRIDVGQTWRSLGVDSLMAVELRNHIEADLNVLIPISDFQAAMSINRTVEFILSRL